MNFVIKGTVCYSETPQQLAVFEQAYLVCEGGISRGVFAKLPEAYAAFPLHDHGSDLIIPGLCDLHIHAPQYTFRGLGMDLELIDWLNTYAFPEEAKYADLAYADKPYSAFAEDLKYSATTRASVYGTIHTPATVLLMEKLEAAGLVSFVGKVNMDRNCPDSLREESWEASCAATGAWLEAVRGRFRRTMPIITPRFIPSCSAELLRGLGGFNLPVQSHLSENLGEVEWVRELHPETGSYGEVYDGVGLLDENTIMAHCIYLKDEEERLLRERGVFVAHCPQSNVNLASGIAPVRRYLDKGIRVGLGSDVAGGCHTSIFRAMSDAIWMSKLHWRLVNQDEKPLSEAEAFYMGTVGGGEFFGKVGSFREGYEFDALVIDDSATREELTAAERLSRVIYLADERVIRKKYVRGECLWER